MTRVFSLTPLDLRVNAAAFKVWKVWKRDSEVLHRNLLNVRRCCTTDLRSGFLLGVDASVAVRLEQLNEQLFTFIIITQVWECFTCTRRSLMTDGFDWLQASFFP